MCVYVNPDMDRYGDPSLTHDTISQMQSTHNEDPTKALHTHNAYESNPERQQLGYDDQNVKHNLFPSHEDSQGRPVPKQRTKNVQHNQKMTSDV